MKKERLTPVLIRVGRPTMSAIESKLAEINESRDILLKRRLTKGDLVAIGIANLSIKKGVHS